MKALSILLLASVCAGQTGFTFPDTCAQNRVGINSPCPKPLKCGKYEFVATDCVTSDGSVCLVKTNPRCAPIMHEVREKEWQEMVGKLELLEKKHDLLYDSYITLLKKLGTIGAKSGAGKE